MNKTILVGICLMIGFLTTHAEEKKGLIQVKGHVLIEGTDEDIPYVTITVQDENANVITRQASDGTGKFTVQLSKSGSYQIVLSAVGYATTTKDVTIGETEKSKDLGKIGMKEGVELKEVSVTAQKPLIKSDPDKLIYSVEADPEAQSNTLLEIIRKVPLLTVDAEENVTLNGQSNYKVLVNGKSSSLMSNNFKEVIKSMPANSIKDIEVITNPSSKYEAEGVGGIINIITARNTNNGYTGSVGVSADTRGGYGANAYISANINKFSFSTRIYNNQYRQPETEMNTERENYNGDEFMYRNSDGKSKYKGGGNSIDFEAGYEIDTFNLISASGWGYLGNNTSNSFSDVREYNRNHELTRQHTNGIRSKGNYGFLSGNIDYQRSFPKKDKTFTASYKIEYNPNNSKNENNLDNVLNYVSYRQKDDNEASGQTHTVQLDYFDPITENHQLETGIKGIFRLNSSETDRFYGDSATNEWVQDTKYINDLDYNQYIVGAYAGYLFKYKKISTKVGGRLEYTFNDGKYWSKEGKTTFDNNLFNFIPYVNFTYALKPTQTIKLSYTQRLYRPGIWYLNPYANNTDPQNISSGNPDLDAEVAHSFSASYGQFSPKFNFNVELNAAITDNSIESYSYVMNDVTYTTYDNIGSNQRYGMNLYASYRPSGKINIYINGRINYLTMEANDLDVANNSIVKLKNDGFTGGGNIGGRVTTWKGGSVSINGGGGLPWIMLQGKQSGYYYTSMGVTQKLLKEKLDISVYAVNPFFRKIDYWQKYDDENFRQRTENYRWGQTFRLSIMYRFGKMNTQVKKARRSITNDDQRGGGEGGGGGQGGEQ